MTQHSQNGEGVDYAEAGRIAFEACRDRFMRAEQCYPIIDALVTAGFITRPPAQAGAASVEAIHPETEKLVDDFAAALKGKLAKAEVKYGYSDNWRTDDWEADCQRDLLRHVEKGDPLDVAAYAAFCWARGWKTSPLGRDADEFSTVEAWEHDDQRELSLLYNHAAHDRPQFNRGQMRLAIRHGRSLAATPAASGEIPGGIPSLAREPATADVGREAVEALVEPWKDHHGPLPDFDSPVACVFDSGVQYAVELLAKELKVTDWTPCDGTEEYDGDLGGTLMNIVREALPLDEDGERMWPSEVVAALSPSAPSSGHAMAEGEVRNLMYGNAPPTTNDAIPAGMARWDGGDSAPEDWDGEAIWHPRFGTRYIGRNHPLWKEEIHYTPYHPATDYRTARGFANLTALQAADDPVMTATVRKMTAENVKAVVRAWVDADDATHWGIFETALDAAVDERPERALIVAMLRADAATMRANANAYSEESPTDARALHEVAATLGFKAAQIERGDHLDYDAALSAAPSAPATEAGEEA